MKTTLTSTLALIICAGLLSCSHKSKSNIDSSKIEIYTLKTDMLVGTTKAGQKIPLGGFSALQFKKAEGGQYSFYTITDRGPNALEFKELAGVGRNVRPFLIPDYSPLLVEISTTDNKTFIADHSTHFKIKKNYKLTGLPHQNDHPTEAELAIDIYGNKLQLDNNGADSEGFCKFNNNYLVSEEYGPDLFMFNSKMMLVKKWTPGMGLPADFAKRKMNRGLESLACSQKFAYLMLQSPLVSDDLKDKNYIRIAKFDPLKRKTLKEFFYPVKSKEADKIGDISLIAEDKLIVIEQNGKLGSKEGVRKVYKVDLTKANAEGQVQKELVVDLNTLGFDFVEKIEGIAFIDSKTIAVITDNDFALDGMIDLKTGLIKFQKKDSYLAIIHLDQELK
ncbi:esterase-like activity of phytase family protein [bacterium]|nr:esterase-like activity of phytase family protein [bacterium]